MRCSQCSRPAMYNVSGHLLCLEHHNMIVQNAQVAQQNSMVMMNYLRDQMGEIFGQPPVARIQVPQNVVNHTPVTYNNIRVNRSVIGSINTAQVGRIDVAMEGIANGDNDEIKDAIKALTEAVVNSTEASNDLKNKLIEQLGFLAEQAVLPEAQRQKSVISMVLESMPTTIAIAANITTVWDRWGHTLLAFFS